MVADAQVTGAGSTPPPLPPGTGLSADPSLQRRHGGRLLSGGAPLRFVRLSEAGANLVGSWLDDGTLIGPGVGANRLARRLIDAGMVHPVPPAHHPDPDLCVVIPVKDDQAGLDATLQALGGRWPVVVVDDGSAEPARIASGSQQVRLVRRAAAGGPGVARQDGLRATGAAIVAFVDAGVELSGGDLTRLCRWFADDSIVAVGPRVACRPDHHLVAGYEQRRSPLDLGTAPSLVGPGRVVAYLPTACLVARRDAITAAGGFDPALRFGEDVDLVWRLLGSGAPWRIRYDPAVVALHPARPDVPALIRQRIGYGSSAAPLAARHGPKVAPVRLSSWSLACWALALGGRPVAALALAGGTAAALVRKLTPVLEQDRMDAVGLTVRGHWAAGGSLADVAVREWWPLTALAALTGRRRAAAALVALAAVRRFQAGPRRPLPDAAVDLGLGALDNLAYGTGVWRGAVAHRSVRCLLPHLVSWPGRPGS